MSDPRAIRAAIVNFFSLASVPDSALQAVLPPPCDNWRRTFDADEVGYTFNGRTEVFVRPHGEQEECLVGTLFHELVWRSTLVMPVRDVDAVGSTIREMLDNLTRHAERWYPAPAVENDEHRASRA